MNFHRILFERPDDRTTSGTLEAPAFFADSNLDQIVDAIAEGKEEYNLRPLLYKSLSSVEAVQYRQEIMQDLERDGLLARINAFAKGMRTIRAGCTQADQLRHKYQKEAWILDAAN